MQLFRVLCFGLTVLLCTVGRAHAQVANDDCTGAVALGVVDSYCSGPAEFTTIDATSGGRQDTGRNCILDTAGVDVWFSFRASSTEYNIRVIGDLPRASKGTLISPEFALFSGTCADNELEACSSDATGANVAEVFGGGLVPGELYYLRVSARDGVVGTFQLCVNVFEYVPEPQSDCLTGVVLCDKQPFSVTRLIGGGTDRNELADAVCLNATEEGSAWYRWTCREAGTLGFSLTPSNPDDDLDFAVYELPGGLGDCAGKRTIRCEASGAERGVPDWFERCHGPTGLREGETDEVEFPGCPPENNAYVAEIDMVAGRSYALVVNNFSQSGNGFAIEWTGTGTFVGPDVAFAFDPREPACDKDEITFTNLTTGVVGPDPPLFQWSFGEYASQATYEGFEPPVITYEAFGERAVVLRLTDRPSGCVVTAIETVEIDPCCTEEDPLVAGRPEVRDPVCPGSASGEIGVPDVSGPRDYFYSLDGSLYGADSIFSQLRAGEYTVYLENIKGCRDTVEAKLTDPPPFDIEIGPDRTIDFGDSLEVVAVATGTNELDYAWTGVDSIECLDPSCSRVAVFAYGSAQLEASVADADGCLATDFLRVDVRKQRPLYAPTAFSPNGDERNDRWTLYGPATVRKIVSVRVFDRWGSVVWRGFDLPPNDPSAGWDGLRAGANDPLPPAVYAFVAQVEYIDGEVYDISGDINLLR